MPIYEYRCKECAKVSEFQMKMSDPDPVACPSCAHPALAKIMSLPSFQLKGGGWYSDAYDGKSNKAGVTSAAEAKAPAAEAATPAAAPAAAPSTAAPASSPSTPGSTTKP